jgi:hypothetical protein
MNPMNLWRILFLERHDRNDLNNPNLAKGNLMIAPENLCIDEMELGKQIEEAAYFCYLYRVRYAQAGDTLGDWIESENKVRERLTPNQEKQIEQI